jgi:hypothetical protein
MDGQRDVLVRVARKYEHMAKRLEKQLAAAGTMKNCSAGWSATSPADRVKTTYAAYSRMCLAKTYAASASTGAMSSGTMSFGATPRAKQREPLKPFGVTAD